MAYIGARPDAFQYTSTSYQQFSGDNVTTTFTLSRQVSANGDVEVVVNSVPQEPGVAYYVTNLTNLIFTEAPSAGNNNIYVVYRNYVQSGIAPGANTVTTSAIAANTIQPWQLTSSLLNPVVNTFTGTGSNTAFTLAFTPPSANAVVVTINGITQNPPANYSVNNNVLTFTDPPALNSIIRVMQQAVIGSSIVPIDGSVTTSKLASNLTLTGPTTLSGNLTFSGTGTRILGDFSNATVANRVLFQTSTTNSSTSISAIPNGTGTGSSLTLFTNGSDPANSSLGQIRASSLTSDVGLIAGITGTGTYLPLTMYTGGSERLRIDTSGNILVGTTSNGSASRMLVAGGNFAVGTNGTSPEFQVTYDGTNAYLDARLTGGGMIFRTNGSSERMRISSTGGVSIGTTTDAGAGGIIATAGWIGTNSSAGKLGGIVQSFVCERSGTGSIGGVMAFGNGTATGKGIRMPFAGKLLAATLVGTNITGTVTVDVYQNSVANTSYRLTATNAVAGDIGVTQNFQSSPLTFAAGDSIGWYQNTVPSTSNAYNVSFYVIFD